MAAAALMIPAVVTMMVLLLNSTGRSDALTSFKPLLNNDTSGRAGKYLVKDQDMESEFMMESHISRILASQNFQTTSTADANKASSGGCDRPGQRYQSCLGPKRNNPMPENCGTYNRNNPC